MANSITFSMNGLTVIVHGHNGYINGFTYTNNDPIDYIFQVYRSKKKEWANYRFRSGAVSQPVEGFVRTKTDEAFFRFQGAIIGR